MLFLLKLLKIKFKLPERTACMELILSPEFTRCFKVSITGSPAPTFVSNKKGTLYLCESCFNSK